MITSPILNEEPIKKFTDRPLAYIDFEFSTNLVKGWEPRLICMAIITPSKESKMWLLDGIPSKLTEALQTLVDTHTLVAHFAIAEVLCLRTLGVNMNNAQVVDTHAEWTQLTNRFTKYNWGKQLQKGKVVHTRPPVDKEEKNRLKELSDRGAIAKQNYGNAEKNLASFVYKFTGEVIDAEHKEAMQQLCIDYNHSELTKNKETVMEYCADDVRYLKMAYEKLQSHSDAVTILGGLTATLERGYFSSILQSELYVEGLPVDRQALTNLSAYVDEISQELKEQANKDSGLLIYRDKSILKINSRTGMPTKTSLSQIGTEDQNVIQEYIASRYPAWPRTETQYSTEADVLELYRFDPVIEIYYQARKSIRAMSSLNGHKADGSEKDNYLLNNIDGDNKLRCFFGCFGTQTGRNAPKASVFILAMAKWLRTFLKPPAGYAIVECDYSSQESLLAGIYYGDKNIVESYKSGDPYLAFGKLAGLVAKNANKAQTEEKSPGLRNKLKNTVLGKSYGMGVKALGQFLAAQTWKGASSSDNFQKEWKAHCEICLEDAQELHELYVEAYPDMHENREELWSEFMDDSSLQIARDWVIGDQVFTLSLLNSPIQGLGARIMRTFTHNLLTADNPLGVRYFSPLHDASFCLVPIDNLVDGCEFIREQMMQAVEREVLHPDAKCMRVGYNIICPEKKGEKVLLKDGAEVTIEECLIENNSCKEIRERLLPYWVQLEL